MEHKSKEEGRKKRDRLSMSSPTGFTPRSQRSRSSRIPVRCQTPRPRPQTHREEDSPRRQRAQLRGCSLSRPRTTEPTGEMASLPHHRPDQSTQMPTRHSAPSPLELSNSSSDSESVEMDRSKSSDRSSDDPQYNSSDPEENRDLDRPHKLVFKCIGSNKERSYQTILRVTRDKLFRGISVPVQLVKEPLNPRDSRAIAFKCKLDDKWHTIGYVISELTDEVHNAMDTSKILSIKLAWVNYVVDWRSGPGFFAGIAIEKIGQWSRLARRKSSTR